MKKGCSIFRRILATATSVGAALAAVTMYAGEAELSRYEASHRAMGSVFTIVLYAPDDETAKGAFATAFGRVVALDKALSDYDPDSELSRLSAAAPTAKPIPVSDDLWSVLVQADRFSRATHGAFDVTVGPLTTLWRAARRSKKMPTDEQLRKALAAVGFHHVRLQKEMRAVTLARPNMRLDLGGIAKGYAVDQALAELKNKGINSALVNGGGDIAVGKAPPGRKGWKIGVASLQRNAPPTIFLSLVNRAVATSGDAWQFVEIDGRRYSHIVDPKTGLGLSQRSSVTVVAPDCTTADALASGVSVLGPTKGLKLIDASDGVQCLIVREEDGRAVLHRSAGFDHVPRAE